MMSRDNTQPQRRKPLRLQGYDYSLPGAYFVTICTYRRKCFFGNIISDEMALTAAGEMVQNEWMQIPQRFPVVELDEYIVMPNHLHAILYITEPVGAALVVARKEKSVSKGEEENQAGTRPATTLGQIVGAFKSITTHAYIQGVRTQNWETFDKRLWQRNYYDRIIRDEDELTKIREYIHENPLKWHFDRENPDRTEFSSSRRP